GIGAFIAFIGLEQTKIVVDSPATLVTLGDLQNPQVLLALFGLILAILFTVKKYKGALMLSILCTTLLAWFTGIAEFPKEIFSMPASISPIAFELDIISALSLSILPVILIFLITDMFDTLGTLAGVGMRANLFKEKNSISLQKTIEADSFATIVSGLAGVTSTTSFIESAAGVEEGGRTGLTAVVTGLLFILPLFLLPFFKAIPSNAIYPILIVIGLMMFSELKNIDYENQAIKFSTFFIVMGMPFTYSITNGLLLGALVYLLVNIFSGKVRETSPAMIILAIVGLVIFFVL
ncbi:MAG: NCS2 family permease, partial [Sulfurimonas sp.]|nr:NCS2 family permease [Sulfurimonas sp.]